jgi:plasmid maintenance system antidote protein VapI
MARTGMTVLERVKRSQQVGSEAKTPTVNQLGDAFSVQPGTSAVTAPPLATPDQVKMMGTPAQKGARIAAPTGESALEQATKLRAPAVATPEEESKKRQAAALAGALGPMGDKVNQLVDAAMANITQQKVETEGSGLQLKVNSAAEVVKKFAPAEQDAIANLVAQIGSTTDPAQKAELVRQLNEKLGRTAESALTAEEVPAFMAAAPETVKGAAATAVTKGIGEKLTLEDLGQLGTSQEELASLLGIDPAEVANLTITDLQNKIAARQQSEFGASQDVQAGMASSLLSSTERSALRDVLATMEETGLAGAEFQVGQIGKDIADGRQVQIGNEIYTVEELLSAPAMTDIVTQVLADPDAKTDFVKSLKETNPDLYNWVRSSKDGLEQLVKGTATSAGAFRDVQQKNIALLKPLAANKDFFKDIGIDIGALSTKELKLEDLPPSAQYVLTQPPGAQAAAADRLSALGAGNVKSLTPEQIKNLRPEDANGPAAQWLAAQTLVKNAGDLNNNQAVLNAYFAEDMGIGDIEKALTDDIMSIGLGFGGSNFGEIDTNRDGKLSDSEIAGMRSKLSVPSLAEVASGAAIQPGFNTFRPNIQSVQAGLSQDQKNAMNTFAGWNADGRVTMEEINQANLSIDDLQKLLDTIPNAAPRFQEPLAEIIRTRRADEANRAKNEQRKLDLANQMGIPEDKRPEFFKAIESGGDIARRALQGDVDAIEKVGNFITKALPVSSGATGKIAQFFTGKKKLW